MWMTAVDWRRRGEGISRCTMSVAGGRTMLAANNDDSEQRGLKVQGHTSVEVACKGNIRCNIKQRRGGARVGLKWRGMRESDSSTEVGLRRKTFRTLRSRRHGRSRSGCCSNDLY